MELLIYLKRPISEETKRQIHPHPTFRECIDTKHKTMCNIEKILFFIDLYFKYLRNVERVNSLKARLETNAIFKDDWEKRVNEKYSSKSLSRRDSLKQVKEQ